MEAIKIAVVCVAAGAVYGILHDQFTARICLEYFTVFHPDVFHTQSPTLLAIGWGILATWWGSLPLGICLALAARSGSRAKLTLAQIIRPLLALLALWLFQLWQRESWGTSCRASAWNITQRLFQRRYDARSTPIFGRTRRLISSAWLAVLFSASSSGGSETTSKVSAQSNGSPITYALTNTASKTALKLKRAFFAAASTVCPPTHPQR